MRAALLAGAGTLDGGHTARLWYSLPQDSALSDHADRALPLHGFAAGLPHR